MSTDPQTQPLPGQGNQRVWQPDRRGNLPLTEIQMDMAVDMDELRQGGAWPPTRFYPRDWRLTIQRTLLSGDLSPLIGPNDRIPRIVTNLFRKVPAVHASLLLLSPPELDCPMATKTARRAITAAVYSLLAHGITWIWQDDMDSVVAIHAAHTDPVRGEAGGGILHTARHASTRSASAHRDAARSTRITADGVCTRWEADWSGSGRDYTGNPISGAENTMIPGIGSIGRPRDRQTCRGGPLVDICHGAPNGAWGTSIIDDMAALVCALAETHDRRDQIMRHQANPTITYRTADQDLGDLGVQQTGRQLDDIGGFEEGVGGQAADRTDGEAAARDAVLEGVASGAIRLSDAIEDLGYLSWNGNLGDHTTAIEQFREELFITHSIPAVWTDSSHAGLSGESLKRLLLPLYAENGPLYLQLKDALETCSGGPVKWEHIFDAVENPPGGTDEPSSSTPADRAEGGEDEGPTAAEGEFDADSPAPGADDQQHDAEGEGEPPMLRRADRG